MKRTWKLWTEREIEILSLNYEALGPAGCVTLLPGRGERSAEAMASRLGLPRPILPQKPLRPVRDRFESQFIVTPGCWLWVGGKLKGYGQFHVKGKGYRSHRYAYELYVGPIPAEMCVCHRCDNPACVNPDHLWLGSTQENTQDRVEKGRNARNFGVAQGMAKLSDVDVRAIRASDGLQREIAARYGIHPSNVSHIKRGKTWPHVGSDQ